MSQLATRQVISHPGHREWFLVKGRLELVLHHVFSHDLIGRGDAWHPEYFALNVQSHPSGPTDIHSPETALEARPEIDRIAGLELDQRTDLAQMELLNSHAIRPWERSQFPDAVGLWWLPKLPGP